MADYLDPTDFLLFCIIWLLWDVPSLLKQIRDIEDSTQDYISNIERDLSDLKDRFCPSDPEFQNWEDM